MEDEVLNIENNIINNKKQLILLFIVTCGALIPVVGVVTPPNPQRV